MFKIKDQEIKFNCYMYKEHMILSICICHFYGFELIYMKVDQNFQN